jgi:LPXTG-motif cell wall-anchored protein
MSQSFWNQQKNDQWKTLVSPLKNNPEIHSHLNNLLTTFYWKFREKKQINKSIHPQVNFQGFKGFDDFSEATEMGHCEALDLVEHWQELDGKKVEGSNYWTGTIAIVLNQKLLLDKLGMDKWFSSEREYLSVGFDELIGTTAHELAHAYQYITNLGKQQEELSQCESTGRRDARGNLLFPGLAAEHTQLTAEIKSMIEGSAEYREFKKWWEEGKGKINSQEEKCSECGTGLYTKKTAHGSTTNKVNYQGRKICINCHHKLIEKENQKQCPYCQKYFPELIENKACEDCAKKNTSYSCKICGEKFPLDANLSFQEAKIKAYQAWKEHEFNQHQQGKKCVTCGKTQGREDFYLATDEKTGQQLGYYCETCKEKLEKERKEEKWEHSNVRTGTDQKKPTNQPHPDNEKKWGSDFGQLKPGQRQDRIKVNNNWKENKNKVRSSLACPYCWKLFDYDKNIEDYLPARKEVENRLNTHKNSCPLKNDKAEQKKKRQKEWDQDRKNKTRIIKRCKDGCWGKILWDKSIEDVDQAEKQAWADLKYHQKHECGKEGKRKIAIYFSPNQGGNEHANINDFTYEDMDTIPLEKDNQGEAYQEQVSQQPKKNYWPLIIGGGLILAGLIGGLVFYFWRKKKNDI